MKKAIVLLFAVLSVGIILAETSPGDLGWDNGILKWKSEDGNFETRLDLRPGGKTFGYPLSIKVNNLELVSSFKLNGTLK